MDGTIAVDGVVVSVEVMSSSDTLQCYSTINIYVLCRKNLVFSMYF
jgi:hypothetical protein